ncbi:hypothetical protein [Streptomyces canus]|uniref:hypothetical protein n=1 Tax=Streptomyces canus TaxID=58343 RepID=UPI002E34D246|nr:hypothetical protein [Streptomyces canus]
MPRTRPAPQSRELPDVGTVRRRARMGTGLVVALLVALLVLPFAVGGIVRSGAAVGLVTCPLAFLLFVELCAERAPTRCSSAGMTARTLTGIRSVDLSRIARVRLQTTFSYGTVHRALLVRAGPAAVAGAAREPGRAGRAG